jgi:hypothetical protein
MNQLPYAHNCYMCVTSTRLNVVTSKYTTLFYIYPAPSFIGTERCPTSHDPAWNRPKPPHVFRLKKPLRNFVGHFSFRIMTRRLFVII